MNSLFYNGNIYTMDEAGPHAEAFFVKDGSFACVGTNEAVMSFAEGSGDFKKTDLGGQCVIPAFNDSHMHFIDLARKSMCVDLNGTKSLDEIVSRMKSAISGRKFQKGEWIEANGWNQDYFTGGEKRFLNRYDLDKVSEDVPIIAVRVCVHIAALNSCALSILGIDKDTAPSYAGLAETDADGEPTGIIKETLTDEVRVKTSQLSAPLMRKLLENTQQEVFGLGITSVQSDDIGFMPDQDHHLWFNVLEDLRSSGILKMHIGEQCMLTSPDTIRSFAEEGYTYGGNANVRRTSVKIYNDGSLGARTASLRKPYNDDPTTRGVLYHTTDELCRLITAAHDSGYPVAIHAIGDNAVETALDAIEKERKLNGSRGFRDGIIHVQITDRAMLERFSRLGIMAFVQPIFIDYDMHIAEDRVGSEVETSYAWKTLIDSGVHVSFGTDCPVEYCDPIPNIFTAVTRRGLTGDRQYFIKEEAVTMEEAIRAYTIEGAYASGEEDIKGTITAGKIADFVTLSSDLFKWTDEDDILQTKVTATYVGGSCEYRR